MQYIKSPEAKGAVLALGAAATSAYEMGKGVSAAWGAASAVWAMQVTDSLDAESMPDDYLRYTLLGVREVIRNKEVHAAAASIAESAVTGGTAVASASVRSAAKIVNDLKRSPRWTEGAQGLADCFPLLLALLTAGIARQIDVLRRETELPPPKW